MPEQVDFRSPAHHLRRNWWLLAGTFALGGLGVAAMGIASQGTGVSAAVSAVLGLLAIVASPVLVVFTWLANPQRRRVPGEVTASPDGVRFQGRMLLARDRMHAGFTIPKDDGVIVQLQRSFRRPVELVLPSLEAARALLCSLGLDASQTAASVPLRSLAAIDWRRFLPAWSLLFLFIGSAATAGLTGSPSVTGLVALVGVVSYLVSSGLMFVKAHATVAADGVLVSFLGKRRFYPYATIAGVTPTEAGYKTVALTMRDGGTVHLPLPREWSNEQETEAARRLASRIQTAMTEHGAASTESDLQALAQQGRPARAWVTHLRTIGTGANADHRRAPVPPDRLWRIVESPMEDPEARAAAAIALGFTAESTGGAGGAGGPEGTSPRLRAIARNTAEPRLRVAFETAATTAARGAQDELAAEEEAILALERVSSKAP
ncbi:MAG: hypothetical protein R3F14_24055 [Polyangiaceae bacterium]